MSNNVNDLLNAIRSIDNHQDLSQVIDAVNQQNKRISRMKTKSFSVGDYVYFTDKSGRQVDGVVTKVNPKTVIVMEQGYGKWRVDASLLSKDPIKEAV